MITFCKRNDYAKLSSIKTEQKSITRDNPSYICISYARIYTNHTKAKNASLKVIS